MSSDAVESEDLEISARTYNKLSADLVKNAYANGKISGEEQQQQEAFDNGFEDGFRVAYQLELQRWNLQNKEHSNLASHDSSTSPKRPRIEPCLLCSDPSIQDYQNYRQKQLDHIRNLEGPST